MTEYTHPADNRQPASCNWQITSIPPQLIDRVHTPADNRKPASNNRQSSHSHVDNRMRQNGGYLSVTWGRMTVICQLHEAGWRLSVSYMRQVGGCLQVCVIYQLLEAGLLLSAGCVYWQITSIPPQLIDRVHTPADNRKPASNNRQSSHSHVDNRRFV
jgi:putative NIF3 family GTP cyclohydrolase 1 type 2